MDMLLFHHIS